MPFILDDLTIAAMLASGAGTAGAGAATAASSGWLMPLLAGTALSAGAQAAQPKFGMTQPEGTPQSNQAGGMDLTQLLAQAKQKSALDDVALHLQNRLPQPAKPPY